MIKQIGETFYQVDRNISKVSVGNNIIHKHSPNRYQVLRVTRKFNNDMTTIMWSIVKANPHVYYRITGQWCINRSATYKRQLKK